MARAFKCICDYNPSYFQFVKNHVTKAKQEKNFTVHWVSSECRENFCGVCFICIENAAIAQSIHKENFCNSLKITIVYHYTYFGGNAYSLKW